MNTERQIRNNMNSNGGGIAKNVTGKFESNRNALAKTHPDKRTAGQVATSLRRQGHNIKAAQIKAICEEWHHAGYNPGTGQMSKVYYTKLSNKEVLKAIEDHKLFLIQEAEKQKELSRNMVTGFYWKWESDYSGRYGKKVNYKAVYFYSGNELNKPKNFV